MVPVTLLTLAWNCPRFLELRTCYDTLQLDTDNTTLTLPRVCISHLRMDESYSRSETVTHRPLKIIFGCFFADSAAEKSAFQLLHKLQKFLSKDVSQIFYKSVLVIIFSFAFLYTKGGIY